MFASAADFSSDQEEKARDPFLMVQKCHNCQPMVVDLLGSISSERVMAGMFLWNRSILVWENLVLFLSFLALA